MLESTLTGRLVGHEEKPYEAFVNEATGEKVAGGVTHWVTIADAITGESHRVKCPAMLWTDLEPAWWGGVVKVEVRSFARNNRLTRSVGSVLEAQAALDLPEMKKAPARSGS